MSRFCAALIALASVTAAGAQAAPLPQNLAQLATSAAKSAPCASGMGASGNAVLGAGVTTGASLAAKKAGIENAEVVGLVIGALLTDKIACLLNPAEQTSAATATQSVVTQGVGAQAQWTSTSRPNVSGRSSVMSETKRADGALCRAVRDVVIISGEETTVTKTLCRAAGATGFTLAAAP